MAVQVVQSLWQVSKPIVEHARGGISLTLKPNPKEVLHVLHSVSSLLI